jgi:hypothetical protein
MEPREVASGPITEPRWLDVDTLIAIAHGSCFASEIVSHEFIVRIPDGKAR